MKKKLMRMRSLLLFAFIAGISTVLKGQSSDRISRDEYIRTYKDLAIAEMKRSGIPASITMAQACIESGDGNSRLAKKANNHFGIKCHNDWNGKEIRHDDDKRNECFRKYNSVVESYRDHSNYLLGKSRYAFLFELDPFDYKAWARGLKKAGYATDPSYAGALIRVIEEHKLYALDREATGKPPKHHRPLPVTGELRDGRTVLERNRIQYIIAKHGDSFESLTAEFGKLPWELTRYNDLPANSKVDSGQVIYIQPKRNSAAPGSRTHVVKEGETMYTISQLYGIKLDKLYEKNGLAWQKDLPPGTVLQLRKPLKAGNLDLGKPEGRDRPSIDGDEMYFEMVE